MPSELPRTPKYRFHKAPGLTLVTLRGSDVYLGPSNVLTAMRLPAGSPWPVTDQRYAQSIKHFAPPQSLLPDERSRIDTPSIT
jgi:hypothetical protein